MNFYSYSAQNLFGLDHAMAGSDILIYIPWAIWNLPIWAMQRFGGLNILEHPLMLFYSKLFLIVLLVLSCTLPLLCLCAFSIYVSYRPIYLFTMYFLLMLTKPLYRRMNLLLEMLFSGSLIVYFMVNELLFYNNNYIYLPVNRTDYDTTYTFLMNHLPNAGLKAFTALALFSLIVAAIINHPDFKSENSVLSMQEEKYLVVLRSLLYCIPLLFAVALKCFM